MVNIYHFPRGNESLSPVKALRPFPLRCCTIEEKGHPETKAQFVCYFTLQQSDVHFSEDSLACVVEAVIDQYADYICLSVMLLEFGH